MKRALITGITGQDGSYLAELLLAKGYEVHGLLRRPATCGIGCLADAAREPDARIDEIILHIADMTDGDALRRIVGEVAPDEIYNLAAQSHVAKSFEAAAYTSDVDAMGALRLLEAVRSAGLVATTRFYQASTSELYGQAADGAQTELGMFRPRNPYAIAKLHAFWTTVNYREAWGLHATNGILFNHESPRRGEAFLTRKVSRAVAEIALGYDRRLSVGSLEARRDWGHARDYVEGMWRMLQEPHGDDYVLATGKTHSVRQFVESAFAAAGVELGWSGSGLSEIGCDATGRILVDVDARFFRPTEVSYVRGDASKARDLLGWSPATSFADLVAEMVGADLARLRASATGAVAPASFTRELPPPPGSAMRADAPTPAE